MPKIAVCFFGITRSLTHTIGSIERRILRPARRLGSLASFGHFFNETTINNRRSDEFGRLTPHEHRLISFEDLKLEEPDLCLEQRGFEAIKAYGDAWKDDFKSLRNLIHQLHSLDAVTKMAMSWEPDLIVFARPDLRYHDSLRGPMKQMLKVNGHVAMTPSWQHCMGGVNDRFAICTPGAARAYGGRIDRALSYCLENQMPLHSELLVKDCLEGADIECRLMSTRASRLRFNGSRRKESFIGIDTTGMTSARKIWHKINALK